MPIKPKEHDIGWFYYCPTKPKPHPDAGNIPPPSQIDCLTSIQRPPLEHPRMMLRDTDSNYIRLAKMGGRQDLLLFKENTVNDGPAKPYPRSQWYYLEDNLLEDKVNNENTKKEPYEFGLPEYMIHEPFKSEELPVEEQKVPAICDYAHADTTHATVNPGRIQERIKPGYGIRSQRPLNTKLFPKMDKNNSNSVTSQYGRRSKYGNDECGEMTKLMSNDYIKDWKEREERWQEKRNKAKESLSNGRLNTEGENNVGRNSRNSVRHTSANSRPTQERIHYDAVHNDDAAYNETSKPSNMSKCENSTTEMEFDKRVKLTSPATNIISHRPFPITPNSNNRVNVNC